MSDSTAGQLSPSQDALIPPERAFQLDPNGLGGLAQSVNLFRGDTAVPVTVYSVKGRGGATVDVVLTYASNIGRQANTWNLEAPTGPLGLGWSFGYELIARDSTLSAQPTDGICYLIANGASNRLYRTGTADGYVEYEAENYQFWRIRYYPADERWVITQEDGTQRVYGGKVEDPTKSPVQYGIKWGLADGLWTGPSVRTTSQTVYAQAWNLSSVVSPWGEAINLEYDNDLVQIGGGAGLSYTRGSRLARVNAPMVQTVTLAYEQKIRDFSIREYSNPHIDVSTPDLHAYQDNYQTVFLSEVTVRVAADAPAAPGALVQRIVFGYDVLNLSINQPAPDYYKRYLTSISYFNPDGLFLSNMLFRYYNDPADPATAINPGALAEITYPQGGGAIYEYAPADLTGTSRSNVLDPKTRPYIWPGPTYTVIVTVDGPQPGVTVTAWMWNGLWVSMSKTYAVFGVLRDTLSVSAQQQLFTVSFQTGGANPQLHVARWHMTKGAYGNWVIDDHPAALQIKNGTQGIVTTGVDFVVAVASGGTVMASVWNNRENRWDEHGNQFNLGSFDSFALAGQSNFFALASYTASTKRVFLQIWYRQSGVTSFVQAKIDQPVLNGAIWNDPTTPQSFWSTSNDFAAMTYVTSISGGVVTYHVAILQWDERFDIRTVKDKVLTIAQSTSLPYDHSVVSGTVVGNLATLLRFNGVEWDEGSLPAPSGSSQPTYVYGNDLAAMTLTGAANASVYNPYLLQWGTAQIPPGSTGVRPTISGAWMTVDRQVYYQDATGALVLVYNIPDSVVPDGLFNSGPNFIAYEQTSGNTVVLPLRNGQVGQPILLSNQRIYVASGGPGSTLVGPGSLCTYQGNIDAPASVTLWQFVNDTVEGQLSAPVILALTLDDGYADDWGGIAPGAPKVTRYYYDVDHVTVSPDGSVTEFAAATAVYAWSPPGKSPAYPPPSVTPFGQTEYRYYNDRTAFASGLHPVPIPGDSTDDYPSLLNGMLYDKTDYRADGIEADRLSYTYSVGTKVADLNNPSLYTNLVGAYLRVTGAESAIYQDPVGVGGLGPHGQALPGPGAASMAPSRTVRTMLATAGIVVPDTAVLMHHRPGGHARLYSDPASRHYLPIREQAGRLQVSYAVTRRARTDYSDQTGLQTGDSTWNYNSDGIEELLSRTVVRAWQIPAYAAMGDAHIWSPTAVTLRFWQPAASTLAPEVQTIQLTAYKSWPAVGAAGGWAPFSTYAAASAAAYDPAKPGLVDFNAWSGGTVDQALWRLTGVTEARNEVGAAIAVRDAASLSSIVTMDRTGALRVAVFTNAVAGETVYAGFEAYENVSDWTLNGQPVPNADYVDGDAHSGSRSLRLAPGAGPLATSLTLSGGRTYILTCWVKTAPGFGTDLGSCAWTLTAGSTVLGSFPVPGTANVWEYRHFAVAVPGGNAVAARLSVANDKQTPSSVLLLDDIMLAPLDGAASTAVQDPLLWQLTATVDLNGGTTRQFYDSRQRQTAATHPDERPLSGGEYLLVRQNNPAPGFVFPVGAPNTTLDIAAQDGGAFAFLTQGEQWRDQWNIGNAHAWRVANGRLIHAGSAADSIGFAPTAGRSDYGFRVSMFLPQDARHVPIQPKGALGLDIGSDLSLRWTAASGWSLTLHGTPRPVSAKALGNDWHVSVPVDPVTGQTAVFVWIDGEAIFATTNTAAVSGQASLVASDPDVAFASIFSFAAPRLSASYLDGSGKERQKQSFTGSGIIVAATLFDAIGRSAIATKPAELPGAPLGYRLDLVTGFNPTSGVLAGAVANAWPGDDGYPYVRTEYLRTAQSLVSCQGAPGKTLAIIRDPTGQELNPHIRSFVYGTNIEGSFGGDPLPSGEYFVTRTTDANGDQSFSIETKVGQVVGQQAMSAPSGGIAVVTQTFYDHAGRGIRVLPPNGVAAKLAGESDWEKWASTTTYDFLGQSIESSSPDSGVLRMVFDNAGRGRFTMDADGAAASPNIIRYIKYDSLGREIEGGIVRQTFDRNALEQIALNDPAWPGVGVAHTVSQIASYDGDGSDPTQFGRLVRATAPDAAGQTVIQEFRYDLIGNRIAATLTATAFDTTIRETRFAYDNLSECIRLTYPAGSAEPDVTYSYDRLGRNWQVGTPSNAAAIGTYRFNAMNALAAASLPLSQTLALAASYVYGPPGWLTRTQVATSAGAAVFDQRLTYTDGGYNGAGYYDGKVASATQTDGTGATAMFAYDGLSRLTHWREASGGGSAPAVDMGYDPNGNILTKTSDGSAEAYRYDAHSNRVASVDSGGTAVDAYTYDAAGAATFAKRLDLNPIVYSPATGMTSSIAIAAAQRTLRFSYTAGRERAVKLLTDSAGQELSAQLYMRAADGTTLFETRRSGAASANSQFVHGPDGFTAYIFNGRRYRVVADKQGSVRRLVDNSGTVVASFDYGPFGIVIRQGGSSPDIILYRYTGQELDNESGLYNYHARFYDPQLGRFIDIDPAGVGTTPYGYVLNDPINLTDPTGEFPWLAFLIVIAISAAIGAVAGAVSYAVSHQGDFDAGKFFLYALVGGLAGAAGGAAAFFGGILATGALATIGFTTSTSVASGVIVGAVSGAVDGAVSGTLSQLGANLIERRPLGEGLGQAALMGAGIGALTGGALGLATGVGNRLAGQIKFDNPDFVIGRMPRNPRAQLSNVSSGQFTDQTATFRIARNRNVLPIDESFATRGGLLGAAANGNPQPGFRNNGILAIRGHGELPSTSIQWAHGENLVPTSNFSNSLRNATNGSYTVRGIDLISCFGYSNGSARVLARQFNVPVRAPTTTITTAVDGSNYIAWWRSLFFGGSIRTYYPSQLRTSWNYLFGY